MHAQEISEDYAIVLQQIGDDEGDNFDDLAESLRFERGRLLHIIQSLHHKGLIKVEGGLTGRDIWLSLSGKGKRLMHYLWPESNTAFGY